MLKTLLIKGLRNGAVLSATTTGAILVATQNERDGAWGAINNISHIVDGDDKSYGEAFDPRDSGIGLSINATAMTVWALMYEFVFGKIKYPQSIGTASAFTLFAYIVDYYLVPKRYTPGIEHKISKKAIFIVYVIMAITLIGLSFQNSRRR